MTNSDTPEITLFFSMGFVGMDNHVEEHIHIPVTDDEATFNKVLQVQGQLAQLKMQVNFAELMVTEFPKWIAEKAAREGWEVPDNFKA